MRTFVAVWPSPDVVDVVAAHPRPQLDGVRWTRADQWHVTLRFLGEVDDDGVPELGEALRPVAARHAARTATMGPSTDRFGGAILHVPVDGLDDLADDVVAATSGFGDAPVEDRPFHGHITLARLRSRRGRRPRAAVPRDLLGVGLTGSWTVNELAVVASERLPDGARYRTVTTIPLGTNRPRSG